MEFFENRPKRPFIGFIQVWQWVKKQRERRAMRKVLLNLSDEQLKDVGLRRDDLRY